MLWFLIFTAPGKAGSYSWKTCLCGPQFRGRKIGKSLLAAVARIAKRDGCHGMRWEVLDWNHSAVEFYKSLGADFLDDWRLMLLKEEDLRRLAESAS